jgi:hypothetical protein
VGVCVCVDVAFMENVFGYVISKNNRNSNSTFLYKRSTYSLVGFKLEICSEDGVSLFLRNARICPSD